MSCVDDLCFVDLPFNDLPFGDLSNVTSDAENSIGIGAASTFDDEFPVDALYE